MSTHETKFKKFLATALNTEQKRAVTHENGPLLIIAGAGSGKTRVITAKIAYLILEKKVATPAIVALTFTNKAAAEMKERIAQFLGTDKELPFIGTFHSYCVRLLRKYNHLIDSSFFSILDSDDQQKLISAILQRNNLQKKLTAKSVAYQISQIKNHTIHPDKQAQSEHYPTMFYDIYRAYETEKAQSKSFDFDDLLLQTVKLFDNKEFKDNYHNTIDHVLIDEYQDTNIVQHELLKRMTKKTRGLAVDSITVVGDEDQSIYSWRGATVANMQDFEKVFTNAEVIKIEQNYRSAQSILDVANTVIHHNNTRNPKKLWSEKKEPDRVRMLTCVSEYQEADAIIECIRTARTKNKNYEIALLYRAHAQSRALEETFIKQALPYKIIGGIQFYDRKEIKDLLAYLRLVVNPFDRAAFFRIINIPTRGLGKKFEEQFYTLWQHEPFLRFDQIAQKLLAAGTTKTKLAALAHFVAIYETINPQDKPADILNKIIERTRYLAYLKTTFDEEDAENRIANVHELVTAIEYFQSKNSTDNLANFLHEVALMQEKMHQKAADDDKPILLMTLHAAKGLEFDMVILTGLEDGILPSIRSLESPEAIQEERRLFYVGMTRAREWLLLTHAKYRYTYGKMTDQQPSRFLQEIPRTQAAREDCSYWNRLQIQEFFARWQSLNKEIITKNSLSPAKLDLPKKKRKPFKIFQPVMHKKYGTGIVQKLEERDTDTIFVTVKFKAGIKKIASTFLTSI